MWVAVSSLSCRDSCFVIAGDKEQAVWTGVECCPSLVCAALVLLNLCQHQWGQRGWGRGALGLLFHSLKAGNGTSEEGCTKQAGLFLCRHVSSRHPGDSGSFLSFGGAEEFGNGLGAGPGAGTRQGQGRESWAWAGRWLGRDRQCKAGKTKNGKTGIC